MSIAAITLITDSDFTFWAVFLGSLALGAQVKKGMGGALGMLAWVVICGGCTFGYIFLNDQFERESRGIASKRADQSLEQAVQLPPPKVIAKPTPDQGSVARAIERKYGTR